MPVAHLNDTELFYIEVGKGLPCLVMHGGLGSDHTSLHPWLDPLGDVMHLVYYDHRGNGRSGRPPSETITFEQLCAEADALREHLGFEKVAVLGLSFGGCIALEYALRYPERISHLILLSTAPGGEEEDEDFEAAARRKGATTEQLEALENPVEDDAGARRMWELARPLFWREFDADLDDRVMGNTVFSAQANKAGDAITEEWDFTPRLGEIRTPTLVLVGREDVICPPSQSKIMHEGIPDSELVVFEQSGHFVYVEEAEAFFDTVRGWLQRT
jgi:proline iminopeptidase